MQLRLRILTISFFVAFLLLISRLFFWQIIKGDELAADARLQYEYGRVIAAPRGNIFASDESWLAARKEAWLIYVYLPEAEEDISKIADKLAPLLLSDISPSNRDILDEANRIKGLLSNEDAVWVPIRRKISTKTKDAISALNISGVGFG